MAKMVAYLLMQNLMNVAAINASGTIRSLSSLEFHHGSKDLFPSLRSRIYNCSYFFAFYENIFLYYPSG
jgi:hypothetical protein